MYYMLMLSYGWKEFHDVFELGEIEKGIQERNTRKEFNRERKKGRKSERKREKKKEKNKEREEERTRMDETYRRY